MFVYLILCAPLCVLFPIKHRQLLHLMSLAPVPLSVPPFLNYSRAPTALSSWRTTKTTTPTMWVTQTLDTYATRMQHEPFVFARFVTLKAQFFQKWYFRVPTSMVCHFFSPLFNPSRPWRFCPRRGWWGKQVSHVSPRIQIASITPSARSDVVCYDYRCIFSPFRTTAASRCQSDSWGPPSAQRAPGAGLPRDCHPEKVGPF